MLVSATNLQWFVIWRKRVQEALADGQTPLVVYFDGMKGDEKKGLGNSQKGEVRWMQEQGIAFEELDVSEFREKLRPVGQGSLLLSDLMGGSDVGSRPSEMDLDISELASRKLSKAAEF